MAPRARPRKGSDSDVSKTNGEPKRLQLAPNNLEYSKTALNKLKANDRMLWGLFTNEPTLPAMRIALNEVGVKAKEGGMQTRIRAIRKKLDDLERSVNEGELAVKTNAVEPSSDASSSPAAKRRRSDDKGDERNKRRKSSSTSAEELQKGTDPRRHESASGARNVVSASTRISTGRTEIDKPAPIPGPQNESGQPNDSLAVLTSQTAGKDGTAGDTFIESKKSSVDQDGGSIDPQSSHVNAASGADGDTLTDDNSEEVNQRMKEIFGTSDNEQDAGDTLSQAAQGPANKNEATQSGAAQAQKVSEEDEDDESEIEGKRIPRDRVHKDLWHRRSLDGLYALCPYSQYIPTRFGQLGRAFNVTQSEVSKAIESAQILAEHAFDMEFQHHGTGNITERKRYQVLRQICGSLPQVRELMTGLKGSQAMSSLLVCLDDHSTAENVQHVYTSKATAAQISEATFQAYLTHEILHQDVLASFDAPGSKPTQHQSGYLEYLGTMAEWEPTLARVMWRDYRKHHLESERFQALLRKRAEEMTQVLEDVLDVLFQEGRQTRFNDFWRSKVPEAIVEVFNLKCKMELSSIKFEFIWPKINQRFDDITMRGWVASREGVPPNLTDRHENRIRYCNTAPLVKARRPRGSNRYGKETWEIEKEAGDRYKGLEADRGDGFRKAEIWYRPQVTLWDGALEKLKE